MREGGGRSPDRPALYIPGGGHTSPTISLLVLGVLSCLLGCSHQHLPTPQAKMDCIKYSVVVLLSLFAFASSRSHFPSSRYGTGFTQQNTLSPIGANIERGESMKDWVRVTRPSTTDQVLRVARGGRIEIDCESMGSPYPRVQWYKDQRPLTQSMDEDNEIRGFGIAKIVMTYIEDCAAAFHQGTYSCSANSGAETADSSPTTVIVDDGERTECQPRSPRIVLHAPIVMQTMGSNIRIPCRAHGSLGVTWYGKNGQPIYNVPGSRFKVLGSGDLLIYRLKWADMGTYNCSTENIFGNHSVSTFLYPMQSKY